MFFDPKSLLNFMLDIFERNRKREAVSNAKFETAPIVKMFFTFYFKNERNVFIVLFCR